MYIFKPYFIHLPCCGYHECTDGWGSHHPEEANVLVLAGIVTKPVWPLVHEVYGLLQSPRWVIQLGAPQHGLFRKDDLPLVSLTPHVYIATCPVTHDTVADAMRRLADYAARTSYVD